MQHLQLGGTDDELGRGAKKDEANRSVTSMLGVVEVMSSGRDDWVVDDDGEVRAVA